MEVIEDYPMDTKEAKLEVPFIEKRNGDICLRDNKDYTSAIHHYNKALFSVKILLEDCMQDHDDAFIQRIVEEVEIPGSMNLSLCYLKQGEYAHSLKYADKVLQAREDSVKALYRRGISRVYLDEFELGKADLLKAYKLCPGDKSVKEGLVLYKERKLAYKKRTR